MKILITGGAGYIGSHTIIEVIEKTEWEVLSADNFCNSTPETFNLIEQITGKRIRNYNIDLAEPEPAKQMFDEHPDIAAIIHFAALKAVGESVKNPLLYYRNNIISTINLLQCAQANACKHFIFSSSCTVYGNLQQLPVHEETPMAKAESPYGYTKQAGEQLLEGFCSANPEKSGISLRYFNPAGAHQSGLIGERNLDKPENLVPAITQSAAGLIENMAVYGNDYNTRDGTCIRDYVHVSDIARAHILALQYLAEGKNESNYDVFNLGTGEGVSVLEVIQAFEKVSGQKLAHRIGQRRQGDIEAIYSDCSKAKNLLGWKPEHGIGNMMETAWKWQQNLLK